MLPRRMYNKKLRELEKLTGLEFKLKYGNGENPLVLFDNEVVFYGRDSYEDLSYTVELCYKTRQETIRELKEPTYIMRIKNV